MPWFKVDDGLAFHRKTVAAGNPAMGLWVRAGSWAAHELTDGFVPDHMVALLGTQAQAGRLVKAGLWARADGGFQFHEWNESGRQPTADEVRAERERNASRQAEHRKRRREQQSLATTTTRVYQRYTSGDHSESDGQNLENGQVAASRNGVTPPLVTPLVTGGVTGAPTRPDPTRPLSSGQVGGEGASGGRGDAPRPRCSTHSQLPPDADIPPCRACKQLRLDTERRVADGVLGELAARTARRAAIDACQLCDDNGMRETDSGVARCNHPTRLEVVS